MSVVEIRHGHHRHGLTDADLELLAAPDAQPVIARIGASVDPTYPFRMEHVLRVATICVRAKRNPSNLFARPTL